ncbi:MULTISPECIES: NADH-quinone oxidoreductase subunit M [Cyanophyceae]|uniref:NADH-quinone oxidoreductase subunit M n=1 Tax=Cyanophyceae TaxID=3028117 RepID=UPI00168923AD|nr:MULTISPECIES: NADH-quinone oxidoreductase subunit M [Cyanophyceae]MBD1918395.1 NADH-quinone oxidoreductase subunit M [Phormidium sp. FACHB-77]MBD2028736.1 NADH-quinone oxidoreductase subunit M [Phormidium sp. FACHB-322]MBD2051157.1 NADH-quinone oxidoreductase subunit M [Leptolyngbya sp. FACHB-60]
MLSALILIPLVAALVLILWPGKLEAQTAKVVSSIGLVLTLALLGFLATRFELATPGLQFEELLPWVEPLGLSYRLGLDGLSLPLLAVNSLLSLVAIYISEPTLHRTRLYYVLLLVINSAVAGAFLAANLLLFFIFYELELIPLYLLIAIWGGSRRGYAATKFLIYTALSGVLILGAFLGLVWLSGNTSFDYDSSLATALPLAQQISLLVALLIGFGIKVPLFPFHTWLPDAHVEASTPVSVLLAGVLLKLGTYGVVRFGLGLLPDAWMALAPWMATWAVISVLYGSLAAIAQTDMKKMVAYSSIGHMGYVLLAAAASTPVSIVATVFQMISHGLISALLFLLVGVVYKATGTRDMTVLRGLLNPERGLPFVGSMMILGVMASAGIPGMVGFISEFLVFRGSFLIFPVQTLLCMVGSGLTAVYFLLLVNRVFFGRLAIAPPTVAPQLDIELPSVSWRDRAPALGLAVLIIAFGLQPNWLARWSEHTTLVLHQPYQGFVQARTRFAPTALPAVADTRLVGPTLARPIPASPVFADPSAEISLP